MERVLYVIACGAPEAGDVGVLVKLAQGAGWDVCVIPTPAGVHWVDVEALAELTGHPVRSEYQFPGQPPALSLPPASAIVVAPASFNTVNKWATGITDTFALGVLVELMGADIPIVAALRVNGLLDRHPDFRVHVEDLHRWGVRILHDPTAPPHRKFPSWEAILDALHEAVAA